MAGAKDLVLAAMGRSKRRVRERPLISVVTACYNSAAFVERTYASVKALTYKNLEWIVVDDGSTDDTLGRLKDFAAERVIPIEILDLGENCGSERAIRQGVLRARGQFTLILDHDDEVVPTALDTLLNHWEAFVGNHDRLTGVSGRCRDENGKFVGTPLPVSPLVTNELELRHVYKVRGELAGIVRTDVLREAFSEFERGMTHGLMWYRIARRYNTICTNDVVRIYHTDVPTSMSRAGGRYPEAAKRAVLCYLNENADYIGRDLPFFVKQTVLYARYCRYAGKAPGESSRELKSRLLRFVYRACVPLLPLLAIRDRARRSRDRLRVSQTPGRVRT